MKPLLCLSLYGSTEEICREISLADRADLFEIRFDLSPGADAAEIRKATSKPLVFTAHGRHSLLEKYAGYADYLDAGERPVTGHRSVVSAHAGEEDPEALFQRLPAGDIRKLVLETQKYETILRLLQLNRAHAPNSICFAGGEVGSFSRVLSGLRGAAWIYCCLPGRPTGPSQFSLSDLTDVFRIDRFGAHDPARIFGIVGNPVRQSLSPALHNQKFEAAGLPWLYLAFHCVSPKELLAHAHSFGISGFSITHPHKQFFARAADRVSEDVKALDSCNTVCLKNGAWFGINTDVVGVAETIRDVSLQGARVVILGAGSAARTIAHVVRPIARELVILNRTRETAARLASNYDAKSGTPDELGKYSYDVLFQATSVGINDGECPVDPQHLRRGATVMDVIYNPEETLLLMKSKELGCRVINGRTWFTTQAAAQFRWWKEMLG